MIEERQYDGALLERWSDGGRTEQRQSDGGRTEQRQSDGGMIEERTHVSVMGVGDQLITKTSQVIHYNTTSSLIFVVTSSV